MSGNEDNWRGGVGRGGQGSSFRGFSNSTRSGPPPQGRGYGDHRGGYKQGEGGYRGSGGRGQGQGGPGSSSGRRYGEGPPPRRYSNGSTEDSRGGSGNRDRDNNRQHSDYADHSSVEQRSRQGPASHTGQQAFPSLGGSGSSTNAQSVASAPAAVPKASGWGSTNLASQLKSSSISSDNSSTPHRSTHANLRAPPPVNLQRQAATQQQNGQEKMQFLTLTRPGQKAAAALVPATAAGTPERNNATVPAAAAVPASPKAAAPAAPAAAAESPKASAAAPKAKAASAAQTSAIDQTPTSAAAPTELVQPKAAAATQPSMPKSPKQQLQQDQKPKQPPAPSVWEQRKAAAASSSGSRSLPQSTAPMAWSKTASPGSAAKPETPVTGNGQDTPSAAAPTSAVNKDAAAATAPKPVKAEEQQQQQQSTATSRGKAAVETSAAVAKAGGWGTSMPAATAAAENADSWGSASCPPAARAAPAVGRGTPAAPPVQTAAVPAGASGWGAPSAAAAAATVAKTDGWGSSSPAAAPAAPKAAWGSGQSLAARLASSSSQQQQRQPQQQSAPGTPTAAAATAGAQKSAAVVLPGTPRATAAAAPGTPKAAAAAVPGTPKAAAAAVPGTPKTAAAAEPGTPTATATVAPGTPKAAAAAEASSTAAAGESTTGSSAMGLVFGSVDAGLVDDHVGVDNASSTEPAKPEQHAIAAVTPAIDSNDGWGSAPADQAMPPADAAGSIESTTTAAAAATEPAVAAAATAPAARSWAALAAKSAGVPAPARASVQRRTHSSGQAQSHDNSSRAYGRGSSADSSRDYRDRVPNRGRGGARSSSGRRSGFGGRGAGATAPEAGGMGSAGFGVQGPREPRVQGNAGRGLDRQPSDASASSAKAQSRHHYSHKAHEHPEDFADSQPQQQQQQDPVAAAAAEEPQHLRADGVAQTADGSQQKQSGGAAVGDLHSSNSAAPAPAAPAPAAESTQLLQQGQLSAAAAQNSSIVHPVQGPEKPQEKLQAEAAAAAAEDAELNWDLVDPAALEALRKVVAVLDSAHSLGNCRLQPRGLNNTGNTCFMNCTLQALMAVSPFCNVLQQLAAAGPALHLAVAPTLAALAQLATEFQPVAPPEPSEEQQGWSDVPKGKRQKASSSNKAAAAAAAAAAATSSSSTEAVLGGIPLSPVCMNGIVAKFNPRRAEQQATGSNYKQAASTNAKIEQEQEDAQEFLQFLVDAAHEELVKLRSKLPAGQQDSSSGLSGFDSRAVEQQEDDEEWSVVTKRNKAAVTRGREDLGGTSVLSTIFRGSIKSQVKAKGVKNAAPSITVQPFTMLHLDILDSVRSIEDALDHMTRVETIHGYKVKGQQGGVEAEKVVKISKLPQVMLLAVNRYSWLMDHGRSQKLHHALAYPTTLKMKPQWLSDDCPDRRSAQYQLIALVTHHGRLVTGGHYTAHVQQGDGRWMHFNDSDVQFVTANQVLSEKPYLLVYQRA